MLRKVIEKRDDASRAPVAQNGILGPENPKSVTSGSVTWQCLTFSGVLGLDFLCGSGPSLRLFSVFVVKEKRSRSPEKGQTFRGLLPMLLCLEVRAPAARKKLENLEHLLGFQKTLRGFKDPLL